jgi:hypothetical protein
MKKVHRFMSDWKRGSIATLAWIGLAFVLIRSPHAIASWTGSGMFAVYAVAMFLFAGKWIGGKPADFS